MIRSEHLAQAVTELADEGMSVVEIVNKLERFATHYHLSDLLPRVAEMLEAADRKTENVNTLHIRTAMELTASEIEHIQKTTNSAGASVVTSIDEDVVGGFVAEYNNTMFAGDLGHNLDAMKQVLSIKD